MPSDIYDDNEAEDDEDDDMDDEDNDMDEDAMMSLQSIMKTKTRRIREKLK